MPDLFEYGTLIWCYTIGILINGKTDFGQCIVKGLNLVPKPPTRINAFMGGIFIIMSNC